MKYQFKNNNSFVVQVPRSDGRMETFGINQEKILDIWFRRYVPKYLSISKIINENIDKLPKSISIVRNEKPEVKVVNKKVEIKTGVRPSVRPGLTGSRPCIGSVKMTSYAADAFSKSRIKDNEINISNDIGVGILSYNRLGVLVKLIESIRKFTDLKRTTVFVSDESTDEEVWKWLEKQNDVVPIHNDRIGIAGNTNRLLRCLKRFKYKLLLNDDVEVLSKGWDSFYFDIMKRTNIHHFCYRQTGVYGAIRPTPKNSLITVDEKPHGAVMALDNIAFSKVGYFDEAFGHYGYEHVDYSDRIIRTGLTPPGYHDFVGSDKYFVINNVESSDHSKSQHMIEAKKIYDEYQNSNRVYVEATSKSKVNSLTYIIPFRDIGRRQCLATVVNNIKAQKFPEIQIIIAEQDKFSKIDKDLVSNIDYIFVKNKIENQSFCKSEAFNKAVLKSNNEKMILNDADILTKCDYARTMFNLLSVYDAAHIGLNVCYMNEDSTNQITIDNVIDESNITSDRIVGYFEGGSFGINKKAYFEIGGHSEEFLGYGYEDTEFFKRMLTLHSFNNRRSVDFFHLWHARQENWMKELDNNKKIFGELTAMNIDELIQKLSLQFREKV